MSTPDQPPGAWQIIEWLALSLLGLLQAIFGYQVIRIGKLEEKVAKKADTSEVMDFLRRMEDKAERRDAEAAESRAAIHEKINDVALGLARLEGSSGS